MVRAGCDFQYERAETAVEVACALLERSIVDEVQISHGTFQDVGCTVKKPAARSPGETLNYLTSALRDRHG
jgi:hypothetical protein